MLICPSDSGLALNHKDELLTPVLEAHVHPPSIGVAVLLGLLPSHQTEAEIHWSGFKPELASPALWIWNLFLLRNPTPLEGSKPFPFFKKKKEGMVIRLLAILALCRKIGNIPIRKANKQKPSISHNYSPVQW